jgi:uncharacterized protein YbbC (DUF1343 family)
MEPSSVTAQKQCIVRLFNQKAEEFCKDIVAAFPDVKTFSAFKTAFTLMKTLDDKKPRKMFHEYVYLTYSAQLKSKDEDFFLRHEYNTKTANDAAYWDDFIDQIRQLWHGLDDKDKNVVWTYLQVLVKINEKYLAL